jgi:TonB family protein
VRGLIAVALVAACGSAQTVRYDPTADHAPSVIATRDIGTMRAALRGPVLDGGLWFDDVVCRKQFAMPRTIPAQELDAFAGCLAGLGLLPSPRHHELPDVGLFTYAPGIEVEAWFAVGPRGAQLVSIGFAGNEGSTAWIPSVAVEALEPLRVVGDSHPIDADVRAELDAVSKGASEEVFAWGWYKLCVDREGNVIDVGVRDAWSRIAVGGFGRALHQWKFRPFVLGGQAMPVCSLVAATYPAQAPDKLPLGVPPLEPSTVGLHASPQRVSGDPYVQPTNDLKRRIANGYELIANVRFCIDDQGNVDHADVYESTGLPDYDHRLVDAVKTWKYRPAFADGKPVRTCRDVTFMYTQQTGPRGRSSVFR